MPKDLTDLLYTFMEKNHKTHGDHAYNAGYLSGMLLQLAREDDALANKIRRQLNPTLEIISNG